MQNTGLKEAQAGIKIAGRNINDPKFADDTTLMAESEKELKSLLMKVKEKSEKSWLKTQHSKNEDHDIWSHQFSSVVQLCLTLCDPMDCSMPGLPVHHQLLKFTQTHVH